MKHDKHERRYKNYLSIEREYNEVRTKIDSLPMIPYEKPFHKGWWVNFELKDEIKKRDDSEWIQKALDIGYKPQYIHNVKHVRMMRSGQKGYSWTDHRGHKNWTEFTAYRVWLKEKEVEKLHPAIKKYFRKPTWWMWSQYYNPRYKDYYTIDISKQWLRLRVRPRYFTHYQDVDGDLESRRQWLREKLSTYWREFGYSYSKSYPAHKDRARVRDVISKFKKGEVEDIAIEKIPLEYEY